uniref:Uncharacterized protein n=1 Tax=Sander lucioperca TaxID=283035 RepID=A0A8C9YHZ3_SANLU
MYFVNIKKFRILCHENLLHKYVFFFPLFSSNIQDIEGDDIQRDLQKSTMGIYVINKEGGEIGAHDDIGIYVEGVIILDNIGSVAQACAMMLGVMYVLNMAYPKELKYFYEFIQKVLLQMDGERLSPKVLGLKNKIIAGL